MLSGKRYWLIGASEGLGRALAEKLHAAGAHLVLSARNADRLHLLARSLTATSAVTTSMGDVDVMTMDVSDADAVAAAAKSVGPIDGVIYCAGYYDPIAAPDWDVVAVARMCDVNFTGAVRVLGHVVPDFATRGQGHIVLIGSLAGFRGLPGAIGYGASKAALMHLGQTLYADLHRTDICVQLINPGFIKTRLTAKNSFRMPQLMTPEKAADHVMSAMRSGRFQTSFPRPFSWLFSLSSYIPRFLFYRLFK